MQNRILFPILFLFFYGYAFCQVEEYYIGENITERIRIQKIKEIKGEIYKFAENKIEKDGKVVFLFGFDERGNLIRKQVHNSKKDKIIYNYEYKYKSSYFVDEDTELDASGKVRLKSKYLYDKKGNLIEKDRYKQGGRRISHILFKYDNNGNKENEEWYNKKGSIYEEKKFFYDSLENMIEEIHYNDDGSIGTHFTYSYDEKKNLKKKETLYADGNVFERWEYNYDVYGNRLQEFHYFSDAKPEYKLIYLYDELYNITEMEIYVESGRKNKTVKYTYTYY
jgi:hypothetical protein